MRIKPVGRKFLGDVDETGLELKMEKCEVRRSCRRSDVSGQYSVSRWWRVLLVPGWGVMGIASIDQAYNRGARGLSGGKMMGSGFWVLDIFFGMGLARIDKQRRQRPAHK
jgi:hypothetical protein